MTPESLSGIPGTISPETARIRWHRQADDRHGNRVYAAAVADGALVALVSQDEVRPGLPLWHLSVSFRDHEGGLTRLPTWDELKHAKFQLVPANVPMVLIFPRRGVPYVDLHQTTLHLWESTEPEIDC